MNTTFNTQAVNQLEETLAAEKLAAEAYGAGATELAKLEDALTAELCLACDVLHWTQAETLAQRHLEPAWQLMESTWCVKMTTAQVEAYVANARKQVAAIAANLDAEVRAILQARGLAR